jgi:hypothetical protein
MYIIFAYTVPYRTSTRRALRRNDRCLRTGRRAGSGAPCGTIREGVPGECPALSSAAAGAAQFVRSRYEITCPFLCNFVTAPYAVSGISPVKSFLDNGVARMIHVPTLYPLLRILPAVDWNVVIPAGFASGVREYSAARNSGYTIRRAAPFVGKALARAPEATQALGPPPGPLPSGTGRRPSSDSPPDCAVLFAVSPILRTAQ